MTQQGYDDFMQKLNGDAALRQELESQFGSADGGVSPTGLAEFAAGKGYQFNVEEVSGELSANQL